MNLTFAKHTPQKLFKSNNKSLAFTLVELSIVIVIIGLIIGGITAGVSLVNGAKLNSVITEKTQIETAVNGFKLQYNAYPGDMTNAFSYWPTCGGGSAATCNGNGNKKIEIDDEDYLFFEHLALSGLMQGPYSYTNSRIIGRTVMPSDKGSNYGWAAMNWVFPYCNPNIVLGSKRADAPYFNGEALTPAEALRIDTKIDDGKPGAGKISVNRDQERWNNSTICIDANNDVLTTNTQFILTDTTVSCNLYVKLW